MVHGAWASRGKLLNQKLRLDDGPSGDSAFRARDQSPPIELSFARPEEPHPELSAHTGSGALAIQRQASSRNGRARRVRCDLAGARYGEQVVQLKPGAAAAAAIAAIAEASRTASNILGTGGSSVDRLNAYRPWSSQHIRALAAHVTAASLDELVSTRRYWTLQSLEPAAYGLPALGGLVDLELSTCVEALDAAARSLDARSNMWSSWRGQGIPGTPHHAVVLDTNVLLRHADELIDIEWNRGLNVFPHVTIALGIPMVVVEELDRLKDSNASMFIAGEKHATRTLARQALKSLDRTFQGGYLDWLVRQRGTDANSFADLHAILMIDDLHQTRLGDADLEIIDQALRVRPFTADVALATYDQAMIFRARSAGLRAFKPTDEPSPI